MKIEELNYTTSEYYLEDEYFIYDLLFHEAYIKGNLPFGYSVKYEDNVQRDLGKHEYKAYIYDEFGNLKDTLSAFIVIYDEDKSEESYYREIAQTDYLNKEYSISNKEKYTEIYFSSKNNDTDIVVPEVVDGFLIDSLAISQEANINTLFISKYVKRFEISSYNATGFINKIIVDSENPNFKVINNFLLNSRGEVRYYFGNDEELILPDSTKIFNIKYIIHPVRVIKGNYSLKEFRVLCAQNYVIANRVEEIYLDKTQVKELLQFIAYTNLKTITLPRQLKEIGKAVFSNCIHLEHIEIPDSVLKIDDRAFGNCQDLTQIKLSRNLKLIGKNAFEACRSLKSITLPDGIGSIHEYTFFGCHSLEKVVLNEGLESINEYAFKNCKSLKSITLPKSLKELDTTAFTGCTSLESIYIESSDLIFVNGMWDFLKDSKNVTIYINKPHIYEMMNILKENYNLNINLERYEK